MKNIDSMKARGDARFLVEWKEGTAIIWKRGSEMTALSDFVTREGDHYADFNDFAFLLAPARRYYEFLTIILGRYDQDVKDFAPIQEQIMRSMLQNAGPSDALMEESGPLTTLVHLEIESFYLFAKIFLDAMARFVFRYFGPERRVRPKSHDDLARYHEMYFGARGLSVPKGLANSIGYLKEKICDYRDKEISHEPTLRRLKGTSWSRSDSKSLRITGGTFKPRDTDTTAVSEGLSELMAAINTYIQQVIQLVESNRAKSTFPLKNAATGR